MFNPMTMPRGFSLFGSGKSVASMSTGEKYADALRRSVSKVDPMIRDIVEALISPQNLAITVGTLVVWGASHLFGVGEAVDLLLLGFGLAFTGKSIIDAGADLAKFVLTAQNAKTEEELEQAADYFARGVTAETIGIVSFFLLKRQIGPAWRNAKNAPLKFGLPPVGKPPAGPPQIIRRADWRAGKGETSWYGEISVSTQGTLEEQLLVFYHEQAHAFLAPKFGPLRELRAGLRASAYHKSAILKFLEEGMCEMYAKFRVSGVSRESVKAGFTFPIANNYVTVTQLAVEGVAIGTITVESQLFQVFLLNTPQKMPASMMPDYDKMVCE